MLVWFNLQQNAESGSKVVKFLSNSSETMGLPIKSRGIEWSIKNDASRKISAQSRNLGILNESLGISDLLYVEQSRSLIFII